MQRFKDYLAIEKQKQIKKATVVYILFGVPVILIFTLSDRAVVGIDGTLIWRVIGLLPMVIAITYYIYTHFRQTQLNYSFGQWLLTAMIAGVSTMMSGLYYIVMMANPAIDPVGLSGVIAGNLLAIFSIGTLRGLPLLRVLLSLTIPYILMISAFLILGKLTMIQWVFTFNILAAIPLVLLIIRQHELSDNARLQALMNLEAERENLEQTVRVRTTELNVLLKELHHRVRNNLQVILSIINLYESHYSGAVTTDKRLSMLIKVVQMMSDAHSLSYNEHTIEKINMKHFFDKITSDDYWKKDLNIECRIEEFMLNLETAVVIGFIFIHLIPVAGDTCMVSLTFSENKALLSISSDMDNWESNEDYNFAILLSETLFARMNTETINKRSVTRLSIPLS